MHIIDATHNRSFLKKYAIRAGDPKNNLRVREFFQNAGTSYGTVLIKYAFWRGGGTKKNGTKICIIKVCSITHLPPALNERTHKIVFICLNLL